MWIFSKLFAKKQPESANTEIRKAQYTFKIYQNGYGNFKVRYALIGSDMFHTIDGFGDCANLIQVEKEIDSQLESWEKSREKLMKTITR